MSYKHIKLGKVCRQIRGVSYTPEDASSTPLEGYLPLLRANNIQDRVVVNDLVYVNSKKICCDQILREGDILVCASSGSKNLVGKAAIIHNFSLSEASFGAFCKVIRPTEIFAPYLAHFFNSSYYRNTISSYAQGANINNIRNEHLDNLEVPYPSESLQKQIAMRLDKIQELVSLQKEQIRKLEQLVKSRFIEMFGDPITNPKGWKVKSLATVSPIDSKKTLHSNDTSWLLNLDKIESNTGRIIKKDIVPVSQIGNSVYCFQKGQVLYSKLRPYLNKVVLVDEDGFCTSELLPLKPKEELCAVFLLFLLRSKSIVNFLSNKVAGAKMPRVDMGTFKSMPIVLPPLSLQKQFAEFVEKAETQKALLEKRLNRLETLYKSLMQQYFG